MEQPYMIRHPKTSIDLQKCVCHLEGDKNKATTMWFQRVYGTDPPKNAYLALCL